MTRATQSKSVILDVPLLPELPYGFSGQVQNGIIITPSDVLKLFVDHSVNKPLVLNADVCPVGKVKHTRHNGRMVSVA